MRCLRQRLCAGFFMVAGLPGLVGAAFAEDEAAVTPVAETSAPALVIASTGDPVLDQAIAGARASLPHFWEHASKFPGQEHWHIVKIGLPATGGGLENVWIYTTEKSGEALKGVIVTQPESLASGLRKGGKVEFAEADIIDWSYDEDGLRRGEFTKRAEFAGLAADEVAAELDLEGLHPNPVP